MKALLSVTFAAAAAVVCLGQNNRGNAWRNVLRAFPSDVEEWTGLATCDSPPAFLKNPDDTVYVRNPTGNDFVDYFLFGARWSVWPSLACLFNQAQFFNETMKPALLLRVSKADGKYQASYSWIRGSLKSPPLKRASNVVTAYRQIAATVPWFLLDNKAEIEYNFGNDCSSLDANTATFEYTLSNKQAFQGYVNEIVLKRKLEGGSEEELEGFMIAGSQKPGQERYLTAAVSMNNRDAGENCDIEFTAAFNDERYSEFVVDYVKKHFEVTITTDEIKAQLDKIESC